MSKSKISKKVINQRMKAIRPFVKFNYDLRRNLSPQSKAKITKYYKELSVATYPKEYKIYRPRKKEHLNIASQKVGIDNQLSKQLKAVPIVTTDKNAKFRIDSKRNFWVKENNVSTSFVPVNSIELIKDPKAYARKILQENPYSDVFHIKVGQYYLPTIFTRRTFTAGLNRLINRYKGKKKKQFTGEVIKGFETAMFEKQSTYMEWRQEHKRHKKKRKYKRQYGEHR